LRTLGLTLRYIRASLHFLRSFLGRATLRARLRELSVRGRLVGALARYVVFTIS
jgi:hypothetical protein